MKKHLKKNVKGKSSETSTESGSSQQLLGNARVHGRPRMRDTNTTNIQQEVEELRLRDSPSPINLTPWNNITLTFNSSGYSMIQVYQLFCKLTKQLDPHDSFLKHPGPGKFKSDDNDYDEIPLSLSLAHFRLENDPAVQMRVRQIKVWAERTTKMKVEIFEPLDMKEEEQKVMISKDIAGSAKGIFTFGCKLPQHMRETIYYSLDHKGINSPIFRYSTDQHSIVTVHFNVEWKAMTCTRQQFADEIHSVRYRKELLARIKYPTLEPIIPKSNQLQERRHSHQECEPGSSSTEFLTAKETIPQQLKRLRERKSLDAVPSTALREWRNDPILQKKVDDNTGKIEAPSTHSVVNRFFFSSTEPSRHSFGRYFNTNTNTIETPEARGNQIIDVKPTLDKLDSEGKQLINETLKTLGQLTAKLSNSSIMSGSSNASSKEKDEGFVN